MADLGVSPADRLTATSVLRDAAVAAQWGQAELLERLAPAQARRLQEHHLGAWVRHARATLSPLAPWSSQPDAVARTITGDGNFVRIRRTLDYVMPGDRVLEIGVGYGYVSGVLLRDGQVAAYSGIDVGPHRLAAVHEMAEVNGLTDRPIETATKDLFDLTPEWVAERRIDLVLLEEVLEHVDDPQRALDTVARCLPDGSCVVLTVPMLGRLEACWGHLSLFGSARVRRMLEAAGLVAQYVEVVHDAWLFVLASGSEEVPARLAWLVGRSQPAPEAAQSPELPSFDPADLDTAQAVASGSGADSVTVSTDEEGAHCTVVGSLGQVRRIRNGLARRMRGRGRVIGTLRRLMASPGGARGGIAFDVSGGAVLRIELAVESPRSVRKISIDLVDGHDVRRSSWVWERARTPISAGPATHVLRPGQATDPFRPCGARPGGAAVRAEVAVETAAGATGSFSVRRAATVRES